MDRCISGKRIFRSVEDGENALIEAHIAYDYASGSGPVGVYRCDDCGEFHLTSKGQINETLARYLASKERQRDKEARRWEGKLKNRK